MSLDLNSIVWMLASQLYIDHNLKSFFRIHRCCISIRYHRQHCWRQRQQQRLFSRRWRQHSCPDFHGLCRRSAWAAKRKPATRIRPTQVSSRQTRVPTPTFYYKRLCLRHCTITRHTMQLFRRWRISFRRSQLNCDRVSRIKIAQNSRRHCRCAISRDARSQRRMHPMGWTAKMLPNWHLLASKRRIKRPPTSTIKLTTMTKAASPRRAAAHCRQPRPPRTKSRSEAKPKSKPIRTQRLALNCLSKWSASMTNRTWLRPPVIQWPMSHLHYRRDSLACWKRIKTYSTTINAARPGQLPTVSKRASTIRWSPPRRPFATIFHHSPYRIGQISGNVYSKRTPM